MKLLSRWLLALWLLAAASPFAAAEEEIRPFDLVKEAAQNQDHVVLEGVRILVLRWKNGYRVQTVRILKQKGKERLEYFPDGKRFFHEIINDARWVYHLEPSRRQGVRFPLQDQGPDEKMILELAEANYDWELEGSGIVAGFPVSVVRATPKGMEEPVARYWIDDDHGLILKDERYLPDGKLAYASHYTYLAFPEKLPDQLFVVRPGMRLRHLVPPRAVEGEKALKSLDFKPLFPQHVPEGFSLVGTYLTQWHPHAKLHFLYSDGLRYLSIYQSLRSQPYRSLAGSQVLKVNQHAFEFLERPDGNLCRFAAGPLTVAIVSGLPQEEMTQVALGMVSTTQAKSQSSIFDKLAYYFVQGFQSLKRFFYPRSG